MSSEVKPPVTIKSVEITRQNHVAVYYSVTFVDADGIEWRSTDAQLFHNLNQVKDESHEN